MKYRLLGKSGLRVSEICLGTMTFGTEWGFGADHNESQKVWDAFVSAGGNFIDTANRYTEGTSEKWCGEFMKADRHRIVLATKYALRTANSGINDGGNHRKNLMESVEGSLKRLDTPYIDVLYLHAWDFLTPVDEVMRGLDDLIKQGKVLYIAISDTPAWVVSMANVMAELRGWSRFIGLQVEYSLIQRTPERDLIPMARTLDLALLPWAPLAGGALSGKYLNVPKEEAPGRVKGDSIRRNERATAITKEVVRISKELGCTPAQVALKWTMQKPFTSIPIVGARTEQQIHDSLGATHITLREEDIKALDAVSAIELGFPHDFLQTQNVRELVTGNLYTRLEHQLPY